MVLHVGPGRLRHDGDGPTAVTGVGVAGPPRGYRTSDMLLGIPTCSSRTRGGLWALYQNGSDVVVVYPGGALIGLPSDVAGELDRICGDGRDKFTSAAAQAILAFLTVPDTAGERMPTARTWSRPAKGYWLTGPYNQPGRDQQPSSWPGAPAHPSAPQALPGLLPAVERPAPSRPAPPRAA